MKKSINENVLEKDVIEIALLLKNIINNIKSHTDDGLVFKRKYEFLCEQIHGLRTDAKDLQKQLYEEGYTFNAIEQEGYARAFDKFIEIIEECEEYVD